MGSYGRNFDFRVTPKAQDRQARYSVETALPIGAPVVVTGDTDDYGRMVVELAAEGADKPDPGQGGIAVYEYAWMAFRGDDPSLVQYSDKDVVPANEALQVVSGSANKVVLTNTSARSFGSRNYTGRKMVAGVGATPTVEAGDYLCPGAGNATDGYWKKTTDPTEAWLVVTSVDSVRDEVEARLNF